MSLNLNLESAVKKLEAGCIKGNCIDGQGTLITPKKDKYIGQWKDSKPYGQGVYTFIILITFKNRIHLNKCIREKIMGMYIKLIRLTYWDLNIVIKCV